ncbi:MAG: helix-turn-helix transcriptional regulator [Faecalibacterium sp.]
MRNARIMGNFIEKKANELSLSHADLSGLLGCSTAQVQALFKGQVLTSYNQLTVLAEKFQVSVETLIKGDPAHYESTVVHCMNTFDNPENREKILDIIDQYLDVYNAVS